ALRGPLEAKIGIHRPYFRELSTKADPNAVSRAYKDHRQRVAQFLADMNVPASLLDAMDSVPPEQSRYLTKAELITYRLDGPDRAFEERGTARDAAQCHITLAEMRQRNKDAEAICSINECGKKADRSECFREKIDCLMAVSWGLSLPEYKKRETETAARCPIMPEAIASPQDLETNCEMETMLGVKVIRVPQVNTPPQQPMMDAERLREFCALSYQILASPMNQTLKVAVLERMRNRGCLN